MTSGTGYVPQYGPGVLGTAFWGAFDAVLAVLLLLTVSDAFLELGTSSYQWMLCYLMLLMRLVPVMPSVIAGMLANKALFLFAVVCSFSVLWSLSPKVSLVSSIQLWMTMMFGVFLGLRYTLERLVLLLFWTSFVLVLASGFHAMTGALPVEQYDNDGRVIGVFVHKSYLARQALICTLTAITLLLLARGHVGLVTRGCAILAPFLSAALIVLSESMTNLLMLPVSVGLLILLCKHRLPGQLVLWGLALSLVSFVSIPIAFAAVGIDPVGALFDLTGKDRTLTGRTVIWQIAWSQFWEHPVIGVGFRAFWDAPQFAAERFQIQVAGATSPSLHNFVFETLVGTGLIGLGAVLVHIRCTLKRSFHLWAATRSEVSACALVLAVMLVLLSLNTPGLAGQHEIQLVLLTAIAISAGRGLQTYLRDRSQSPRKVAGLPLEQQEDDF